MRFLDLALFASGLYTTQTLAAFRPDLRENVQVAQLEPEQKVADDATEIPLKAYPGSDFEIAFKCHDPAKQFTFSDCKTWVACCRAGQQLLGSEVTAFDCCSADQDLKGSKDTGYKCCPTGQTWEECNGHKVVTCAATEILVNGQCVCPAGTYRTATGQCEALECSSGLQSGK